MPLKRRSSQKDPKVVPIGLGPPKLAFGGGLGLLAADDGRLLSWAGSDVPEEELEIRNQGRRVHGVCVGFGLEGALLLAWTMSGRLYAWGDNRSGAREGVGMGDWEHSDVPQLVPMGDHRVVGASCGAGHVALAVGNGVLLAAGGNGAGQLGLGGQEDRGDLAPVPFPAPTHVVSVACGNQFTLAVGASGELYSFGRNDRGQLGHGDREPRESPALVAPLARKGQRALSAAAGDGFAACVTEGGGVFSWGWGADGRLGHGEDGDVLAPEPVTALERKRVVQVSAPCCGAHALARTAEGAVYSWGCGAGGRLGHGDVANRVLPTIVEGLRKVHVVEVCAGGSSGAGVAGAAMSCALTANGSLLTWGRCAGHGGDEDVLVPRIKQVPKPTSIGALPPGTGLDHLLGGGGRGWGGHDEGSWASSGSRSISGVSSASTTTTNA